MSCTRVHHVNAHIHVYEHVPKVVSPAMCNTHLYNYRSLKSAREGVSQGGLGLLGKHRKRERLKTLLDILKTLKTLVSGMHMYTSISEHHTNMKRILETLVLTV